MHFVDENLRKLAGQNGIKYQPELSVSLQRVIQRAAMHVQSVGKNSIKGLNLLVASFQEEKSFGIQLLQEQNVTRLKVLEQIAHTLDKAINLDQEISKETGAGDGNQKTTKASVLDQFGINLMEAAKNEELDTLVGREEELERIQEVPEG